VIGVFISPCPEARLHSCRTGPERTEPNETRTETRPRSTWTLLTLTLSGKADGSAGYDVAAAGLTGRFVRCSGMTLA
jgi:hypothetical protein